MWKFAAAWLANGLYGLTFYRVFRMVLWVMVLVWGFFRIRNVFLVQRLGQRVEYRELKRLLNSMTPFRYVSWIFWFFCGMLAISVAAGFLVALLAVLMSLLTFFGIAYIGAGGDSSFYRGLVHLFQLWPRVLYYLVHALYITASLNLIRASYIQNAIHKSLKATAPEEDSPCDEAEP